MFGTIYTQCTSCSYEWVANTTSYYFKKYHNIDLRTTWLRPATLYVGDCNYLPKVVNIGEIWCDTPSDITVKDPIKKDVITTTEYMKEKLEKAGFTVKQIIPRPIHDDYAKRHVNHDFHSRSYLIIIAKNWKYKHVQDVLDIIKPRSRVLVISDHPDADFPIFSIDENMKYWLLAHAKFYLALSDSEGFHIPPVEAMSVGTPLIYVNKHVYKEYGVGIKIDDIIYPFYDIDPLYNQEIVIPKGTCFKREGGWTYTYNEKKKHKYSNKVMYLCY